MTQPRWTIHAQRQMGKYISVQWNFFENRTDADAKAAVLSLEGWITTVRPWHRTDLPYMGVADRSDIA